MSPQVYTVSELTKQIKNTLESSEQFNNIWIKGEIYNLTLHSSGHIYFTLKDKNSVISATFFKYANKKMNFKLEEGMSILAFGNITVFEKRGSYQINVLQVQLEGIGELQKKIEQLKKNLLEEGIFDKEKKQTIPFLPKRVGVVTSPTGAAIRDIIKVAIRRYPNIEIILAPAKVQGDDAAETIVRGIEELNKPEHKIDVIIAGRGGGSFEDLMPFNEEIVVRAFYNSSIPIISAVGHQIDHPLSDEAADLSAPTPSAAAEIAVPVKQELIDEINYLLMRSNNALSSKFRELKTHLQGILSKRIFREPIEIINSRELELADVENRIISNMKDKLNDMGNRLLKVPDINLYIQNIMQSKLHRYNIAVKALHQLSPIAVMERGYSITIDKNNKVIRSVDDTNIGDKLKLLLKDGSIQCTANKITKGDNLGKE